MQRPELQFECVALNGMPVTIRPIRPEDREIERSFVESLSDHSRFLRFFSAMKKLSPKLLDHLINVDFPREMAFIATINVNGVEQEIGVARYAPSETDGSAEFAIVVADEWHGQGIGRELLRHLFDVARSAGIRRIEGSVLATNSNMVRFCHGLGFTSRLDVHDPGLLRVAMDL
ncbi:MAG: GNAT family N-acetyltransferase [Gammaproteobacteria bacterium]|nr:GNAT family N-acetyltransferase [Gammaproteobacteria bacterium]MDH4253905.1 GNAT family N-acetyltransferase [Gammaproteobacteria bacterium]